MSVTPAGKIRHARGGRVTVAGLLTHRQRPPTAGGVLFLNLENESGMVNVIIPPALYETERRKVIDATALLVDGRLERADGAVNVVADRLTALHVGTRSRSRDFR